MDKKKSLFCKCLQINNNSPAPSSIAADLTHSLYQLSNCPVILFLLLSETFSIMKFDHLLLPKKLKGKIFQK